jgi:hypothetical protein
MVTDGNPILLDRALAGSPMPMSFEPGSGTSINLLNEKKHPSSLEPAMISGENGRP